MQDRVIVKRVKKSTIEQASKANDPLNIDWLIEQAEAQVKRQREKLKCVRHIR